MNNDACTAGALQFWYQSQGYNVLEGSVEYESKDRWMRMESWNQRLVRLVSESYHSMIRNGDHRNGRIPLQVFLLLSRQMDSYYVVMQLSILVTTHDCLLHVSMVTYLHDLYHEFHSHRCSSYLYNQLSSFPTIAPRVSLLIL